jgi:PPOX class probable F420-dependent enzyme
MSRVLTDAERAFVAGARTATLATITPDGHPRLVPICFVLIDDVVWFPLDEKPKTVDDMRELARVRDIERGDRVALLVDRWSEDWSDLAWVRIDGRAKLLRADPAVIAALRSKYPQYASHDLESRPMIAITIERTRTWTASSAESNAPRRSVE